MTAAAMTYDSLVDDVESYCERSDDTFLREIPRFIALAEQQLSSDVKTLGFVRVVEGALDSSHIVVKPSRWRETKSFAVFVSRWRETKSFAVFVAGQQSFLKLRGVEYCQKFWPDRTVTGTPRFYADYDFEHFMVVPKPVAGTQFELTYYERPDPLYEGRQTNWTTRYAPQLLLYRTLMEAATWAKLPARRTEFEDSYKKALAAIVGEDESRESDSEQVRKK